MDETATPGDDAEPAANRQRAREWRALGALLAVPGLLCTASMLSGGALDPLTAPSDAGAAIAAATGLLGVLSLAFGALLLLTGRFRRSAVVLVSAWVGLLVAEQVLLAAVACPSYLWLPQAAWLAFLAIAAWRQGIGRPIPSRTKRDTGWQLLGLSLLVPGVWFGRSIVYMRLLGEPWAAGGTADLAWWLVQAVAVPCLVAGAWTLVIGRGRAAASIVAVGAAAVAVVLLLVAPDQGLPVTLAVPVAWLAVLLVAETGERVTVAWQRARMERARARTARARSRVPGSEDAPAWGAALAGAVLFAGGFAATLAVLARAIH